MRIASVVLIAVASAAAAGADAPAKRFGVEPDLKGFPQATPKEALASVLKAVEMKRADYVVAQLADPEFVDRRVKETSHDDLLAEVTAKLVTDPGAAKQLRALLDKGTWGKEEGDTAEVSLAEGSDRIATFRKAGGRWFLKQPYKKPVPKTERE
jgi:hypothetical protein